MISYGFGRIVTVCALSLLLDSITVFSQEIVDTVVASVDNQPISFRDVLKRMTPNSKITLEQARSNEQFKAALDELISQNLLLLHAEQKNIRVSDSDIEDYIGEIATRNAMSIDAFKTALTKEGKNWEQYKSDVRLEILKSKIASSEIRGQITVTDQEIKQYLKEQGVTHDSDEQFLLREIFISSTKRSNEEALAIAKEVKAKLDEGGKFKQLVMEYSDNPTNRGLLGTISSKDLDEDIMNAISGIEDGKFSNIIPSPEGYRIIKVESRKKADDQVSEDMNEQARKSLENKKIEDKLSSFFTIELPKLHTVDRKL